MMNRSYVLFLLASLGGAIVPIAHASPRAPAVPLVSVEPHFSLWSAADRLTDVETTHWAGHAQPLSIILEADGAAYRLCGRAPMDVPVLPQTSCDVRALTSAYTFSNGRLSAEVLFTTPRLTDDLDVFSRPVTYVTVRVKGANASSVKATIARAFATNDDRAEVEERRFTAAGLPCVSYARREQKPFATRGDAKRADWGRVVLAGPSVKDGATHFLLAYESGKSARFFGAELVDWWARGGKSFETMLQEAESDYPALMKKCAAFDAAFRADMTKLGGGNYAHLAQLAWRQSFAACKFVANTDGEPFLMSAENGSGGMIATTDVFYPQLPHLLFSSLALVKATLAPPCIYAASTNWPYAYAPHDLGLFPVAEGQFYGMRKGQSVGGGADDTSRMPVEESGNMLIALGALAKAEGNADFAGRWWGEVTKWADYLAQFGYDPGNQLCTDDFAGHLAHNANLSIKAIMGLASYALMADLRGEKDVAAKYRALAASMVPKWMESAKGGRAGGYRLAFDQPDTWSQKYNLVWDRLLGFNLFPKEVAVAEMKAYRTLLEPYGLALDSRRHYTKSDWTVWTATLTGDRGDFDAVIAPLYRSVVETPDRKPMTDWYYADSGLWRGFVARSVVGGFFLPALYDEALVRKYRH